MVAEGACRQDPGPALGCAAPTQLAGRAPGRADGRGQRPSGPGRFGSSEALEGAAGARAPPLAPGASPGCPQDAGRQEPVGTRQRCDAGRPCPREPSASFLRRSDSDSIPEAWAPPAAAPRTGSVGVPGPAVTLGHSGSPEARCGGQRREPRGQPGCGSASRSQSLWTCPDPRVSGGVRDLMDSSWLQAAAVFTRWTQGSSPCPAGAGRGGAGLGGKATCSQASSVRDFSWGEKQFAPSVMFRVRRISVLVKLILFGCGWGDQNFDGLTSTFSPRDPRFHLLLGP